MIVLGLLNIVTFILNFIFGLISPMMPPIGDNLANIIENFMEVLDMGLDLFCFLMGPVASVLVAYILSFQVIKSLWDLIWFIVRKIPMLGIRE